MIAGKDANVRMSFHGDVDNGITAQRVNDITQATTIVAISGETVTFSAGAAGTTGTTKVDNAPIQNSTGTFIGHANDTSFAWVTGTILTAEIAYNDKLSDATQLAAMSNGDYAIDYTSGKILYKKATTGTSDTCNYTIRGQKIAATLEVGDIAIGQVEIKDHDSATGLDVVTDDGAMPATPNFIPVGGEYRATPTTYTDGDATVLQTDVNGKLLVNSSAAAGGSAGGGNNTYSTEQGDFTATVTDATNNVVLSVDSIGGVAIAENHFANAILKVWDASTEEMTTITLDDFTWTAGTKTLDTTNCTGAFTFATADVVALTLTGPDKTYDQSLDTTKVTKQNLDRPDYTDYETIISASDIGASDDTWKDQGAEIDVRGVGELGVDFVYTVNNSDGAQVQFLVKYESAGSDEMEVLDPSSGMFHFQTDANRKVHVNFGCKGIAYVQIQTKATDVDDGGGTEGTISIYAQKFYGTSGYTGLSNNEKKQFFDSDGDNTAQAMKTDRGNLYKLHIINSNTAAAYVQLFNVASGSVTVGTTTPNYVIFVPSEGAVIEDFPDGMQFDTAITYACTTTATGNGDPTTGLTVSGLYI